MYWPNRRTGRGCAGTDVQQAYKDVIMLRNGYRFRIDRRYVSKYQPIQAIYLPDLASG